jgi:hypothetical protein
MTDAHKEQQRQVIRAQLIKEFNAPEKPKSHDKSPASIYPVGFSKKSKFLNNPKNR